MALTSRYDGEKSDLDEVDAFNANQEKIYLTEAGKYGRQIEDSSDLSDEEVMGLEGDAEEDDSVGEEEDEALEDGEEEGEEEAEEDEEKGWGGRQNYYGGDDASDDDDGKQMAEEALKQQRQHLKDLDLDDWVDADTTLEWKKAEETMEADRKTKVFAIEEKTALDNLDDKEKLQFLKSSFPEFAPLTRELKDLGTVFVDLQAKRSPSKITRTKIIALSAYLATITSYFDIFVENWNKNDNFVSMKDSPVMESILQMREVWRQARELPDDVNGGQVGESYFEAGAATQDSLEQASSLSEHEEGLQDSFESSSDYDSDKEQPSDDESQSDDDDDDSLNIDINKKREIKKLNKHNNFNDFTEAATPDEVDHEEKQRRKRTLRFYTSKIDQSISKNHKEKLGGDSDLPYRERLFERQQRLIEEARKRGLGQDKHNFGDDLDNSDADSQDVHEAQEINNTNDNDNIDHNEADSSYYNSIKQAKQDKKSARKQAHLDAITASKQGKLAELEQHVGEDGKRAINYQILKNKGLTPNRKKDNRNSRVKKRKKYEKAQKKLKSTRKVYEPTKGPYEGEKSGIKKGLSRSIKLV